MTAAFTSSARRSPGRSPRRAGRRRLLAAAAPLLLLGTLAACGYGSDAEADDEENSPAASGSSSGEQLSADSVSIGYFANLTHATAVIGLEDDGLIRQSLGGTEAETQIFNAGPSAIEALNAGDIDVAFVGPNPAINGWSQSGGQSLRIVSGAASGGASLVVDPDAIHDTGDLAGKRIATPQLGNTQDVALLSYLADQGYEVDPQSGSGDVSVLRIANSEVLAAFEGGDIDGAWLPEPYASTLISHGAQTLVDEADLWDGGQFVVTQVIASQDFLAEHEDVVEAIVRGVVQTNAWINENPDEAKTHFNAALGRLPGGKELDPEVLDPAFDHVEFTDDPLAPTLQQGAQNAIDAGLLDDTDLSGIYDLSILNRVLAEEGRPEVDDAGLGVGD
ncbi:aliphatic sulfonate ABC transporter substrate-binding protein [Streptomyces hoynatensis]|uniref:Aliphatic sulfonate ABC transporter substrate-binding protein n=1 Tax=Streptomyces hoynatensis TaxID=1141874 RepID=A0A3A9YSM9_9ACTN|nr:aliphatic sulfonate ABC transporter substrate-binding protein [Streptomyces hoynatensis]RKN38307.1 aliphatic sulfonate ABC transporter substrate-binding protein [Streptomyces hoynatensis]